MTLAEAIAHLERVARIKLELANAPRYGAGAIAAGKKQREDAEAIAIVLSPLVDVASIG